MASGAPYGVLRSAWSYENFILEFEWRLLRYGGNNGILVAQQKLRVPQDVSVISRDEEPFPTFSCLRRRGTWSIRTSSQKTSEAAAPSDS